MDRNRLQELIQADLDGELSPAERAELARVLLQDHDARRLQQEFRRTHQLLRDIPAAETPHGLRAEILVARGLLASPGESRQRRYNQPFYRVAAVVLAGVLVVGISELLRDSHAPTPNLQGSLRAASQDHLSLRAENVEVRASLLRVGPMLRLELSSTSTIASEVVAWIDPASMALVGNSGEAQLSTADGQVTVRLAPGSQFSVLEFSGAAPIHLELRSEGRLLSEGKLSVTE
jgi:hypothetical protein